VAVENRVKYFHTCHLVRTGIAGSRAPGITPFSLANLAPEPFGTSKTVSIFYLKHNKDWLKLRR
jgi:hypothetical protein